MKFKIVSPFQPTGDQPEAIKQLAEGIESGEKFQILQGVTGSGKTFTIANVIEKAQRPVLVLSHNKTLAAQLYGEFKQFFPYNKVEYFVSYYDYYQPEAYLPVTDTYIEKDLSINDEIEKLRLSTTSALLSGRRDVIVVSSVSCLYGIGNPEDFYANVIHLKVSQKISRNKILHSMVDSLYSRSEVEFNRGNFRVKGDTIDVFVAYGDYAYRIIMFGDEIEELYSFDPLNGKTIEKLDFVTIFPANIFMTTKERLSKAMNQIQDDMVKQAAFFRKNGKNSEARRIEERVSADIEMMRELGYCPGVENYSRYFDGRNAGSRPFCLLDYFPKDYITVIDESHVTIPQIHAMYGGDHKRKQVLVEYGFRLPAALDNRPLKFEEFEELTNQTLYMSATPADYELTKCEGVIVEQIIRPTGLLDPIIDVRPSLNQMDDLLSEINKRIEANERILVTTLTKKMAEELSKFLLKFDIKCRYIHSDVDTMERVEIMDQLRKGLIDVLVGVNLLREGLDLPEVSLVAILDADKEGFLRNVKALTQTAGRAARNLNGLVIMYADTMTPSMKKTIDETLYRRSKQMAYNQKHGITPQAIVKSGKTVMGNESANAKAYSGETQIEIAAEPVVKYMSKEALQKAIENVKLQMKKEAKEQNFLEAARLRDEMYALEALYKQRFA